VKNLAGGPHFFTVAALYAGGAKSGLSTPSHTITVTGAAEPHFRHADRVDF
jgi:hypothetical protein